jgi:hypothetical protein
MDAESLRAFANRDWRALEASKRAHWARTRHAGGPEAMLRLARYLREHARAVNPDWPSTRDRARDLDHHVRLKQLLVRVAHARPAR